MKKILALVLALMMAVSFAACGQKEPTDEPVVGPGTENPITEYASLEELNEATGCNIMRPGVMGVSDESFCTIGKDPVIAQYKFSVAGVAYTLRVGATTDDISGYYVNGGTAFGEAKDGIEYVTAEGAKLARWFDINGQHVLSAIGEITDETFQGVAEEAKMMSAENGGVNGEDEPIDEPADEPLVGPGTENPITEYTSLEELNDATGCNFVKPGVMGVTDEEFLTIKNGDGVIGEYHFTINGVAYTHRAGATTEDISGYYVNGETAFGEAKDGIEYLTIDDVKLARFFDLNGQHVITALGEIEDETFAGIVEEIQNMSAQNGGANG